jgi:hypothetical protein
MDFEMARVTDPVSSLAIYFHFGDNGCTAQANE